jgi:DNA-directed RNA polymerase specialized sigma24 family protein
MQRDLVERAMAGDHDAFTELARVTVGRLFVIARLILREEGAAEDATQEAMVAAWRHIRGLRRVRRRMAIEVHVSTFEAPHSDASLGFLDRDELERGFRRLKADQRAVLVLHHYAGMPLDDVARALGVPPGTVRSRLHRATQAMRAALEADARLHETDGRRLA